MPPSLAHETDARPSSQRRTHFHRNHRREMNYSDAGLEMPKQNGCSRVLSSDSCTSGKKQSDALEKSGLFVRLAEVRVNANVCRRLPMLFSGS